MEMILQREPSRNGWTLGQIMVDGAHFCFTCEDVVRPGGPKVRGTTAIPAGRYQIEITWSNRFGRLLPLIWNLDRRGAKLVSGDGMEFDGVRIHPGNVAADTEGCVLPGLSYDDDGVRRSVAAFDALYLLIESAMAGGNEVFLDVRNAAG